jgi:hypothetical protein
MCPACLKSDTPVSIVFILFLPNASASLCFFTTIKYVLADFFSIGPSYQIGVQYVSPNTSAIRCIQSLKVRAFVQDQNYGHRSRKDAACWP